MDTKRPKQAKKNKVEERIEFLVEEYKSNCDYVKHTEELRHKVVTTYIIVVGAVLVFIFKEMFAGVKDLGEIPNTLIYPSSLIFLWVYSTFISAFLVLQKMNYNKYVKRIFDVEEEVTGYRHVIPGGLISIFEAYYLMVLLIGAGITFLLSYEIKIAESIYGNFLITFGYIFVFFVWARATIKGGY